MIDIVPKTAVSITSEKSALFSSRYYQTCIRKKKLTYQFRLSCFIDQVLSEPWLQTKICLLDYVHAAVDCF